MGKIIGKVYPKKEKRSNNQTPAQAPQQPAATGEGKDNNQTPQGVN